MRRIKQNGENESIENAREAFDRFAQEKHKRWNVLRYEQEVARKAHRLQKKGFSEEQIRLKLSSNLGYIKHANSINLLKKIGMENSLGKIIKHRRVKPPFEGMSPDQKVPFSSLVVKIDDNNGGGG